MSNNSSGSWFIVLTLLVAMIITLLPLPDGWQAWRPSWVMLVLSFWVISIPERIGLLWAFICGLLLDVLLNTSLGVHSFSLAISIFIIQILYKRIRLFPHWKQALSIAAISCIYIVINFWLVRMTGKSQQYIPWSAIIVNGILWPWVYIILGSLSGYFKVK